MVATRQSVPRDVGTERLPPRLPIVRKLRPRRCLSENRRHEDRKGRQQMRTGLALCALLVMADTLPARQTSPGAGPVIVLETAKGNIEFETYPEEAPKTVAQIVGLVKRNFYNGQRFHRAGDTGFGLVQIGDPQSRNVTMREWWGRAGSGKPIGVAE